MDRMPGVTTAQDQQIIDKILDAYQQAAANGSEFSIDKACRRWPHLKAVVYSRVQALKDGSASLAVTATQDDTTKMYGQLAKAEIPERIGDYRILNLIAVHGQGMVYRADHLHLNRQVVIKLSKHKLSSEDQARLVAEGQALAKLSHPNLAQVYDLRFYGERPYLVLEYIEGRTLADKLKAGGLPWREAARLVATLARAIHHAHELGITHCDLKPANIIVRAVDKVPKIIDFGMARMQSVFSEETSTASSGGTIGYMAPEQAVAFMGKNSEPIDERSDIFALGAMLYEMLCGRRLYTFSDRQTALAKVSKCEFDREPLNSTIIPAKLREACLKALERRPQNRWASAEKFAIALEHEIAPRKDVSTKKVVRKKSNLLFYIAGALVALGLFVGAAAYFSGVLFKVETKKGTLVLRIHKDYFEASVNGREVTLKNTETGEVYTIEVEPEPGQATEMEPGSYEFVIDTSSGFHTATNRFTISSGENKEVEVWWEPKKQVAYYDWPSDQPSAAISPFNAREAQQLQAAWASYLNIQPSWVNSVGIHMQLLPPGEFLMGCPQSEIDQEMAKLAPDARTGWNIDQLLQQGPQHRVAITKPFAVSKHEITRGQFREFVEATQYVTVVEKDEIGGAGIHPTRGWISSPRYTWKSDLGFTYSDDGPVMNICIDDAIAFCNWLSQKEGRNYRVIYDSEWEYACRAGTDGQYYFANKPESALYHEWIQQTDPKPRPVMQKAPNPFGLYDLQGNVREMTLDGRRSYEPDQDLVVDPVGPLGDGIVMRGGACGNGWLSARSARREAMPRNSRNFSYGFRIVETFDLTEKIQIGEVRGDRDFAELLSKLGGDICFYAIPDHDSASIASSAVEIDAGFFRVDKPDRLDNAWELVNRPLTFVRFDRQPMSTAIMMKLRELLLKLGDQGKTLQWQFNSAGLTSEDLQYLDGFEFDSILLNNFALDERGVDLLRKLRCGISYALLRMGLDDELVERLLRDREVQVIDLRANPAIGRRSVEFIKDIPVRLHLDQCELSAADIEPLATSSRIQALTLSGNPLGDAAVPILEQMKQLSTLRLENTQITQAALTRLRAALPNCEIVSGPADEQPTDRLSESPTAQSLSIQPAVDNDLNEVAAFEDSIEPYLLAAKRQYGDRTFFEALLRLGLRVSFYANPESLSPRILSGCKKIAASQFEVSQPANLNDQPELLDMHLFVTANHLGSRFSNPQMDVLSQLLQMRPKDSSPVSLQLHRTAITEESLSALEGLEFSNFELGNVTLSEEGLRSLSSMTFVQTLVLAEVGLTDDGLLRVLEGQKIIWLHVPNNPITAAALEILPAQLTVLNVGNCNLNDQALNALTRLKGLLGLYLQGNPITDQSVENLAELTELQLLDIQRSEITAEGVRTIRQKLPKSQILWGDGQVLAPNELLN